MWVVVVVCVEIAGHVEWRWPWCHVAVYSVMPLWCNVSSSSSRDACKANDNNNSVGQAGRQAGSQAGSQPAAKPSIMFSPSWMMSSLLLLLLLLRKKITKTWVGEKVRVRNRLRMRRTVVGMRTTINQRPTTSALSLSLSPFFLLVVVIRLPFFQGRPGHASTTRHTHAHTQHEGANGRTATKRTSKKTTTTTKKQQLEESFGVFVGALRKRMSVTSS